MAAIAILTAIIVIYICPLLLVVFAGESSEHGDFKGQL